MNKMIFYFSHVIKMSNINKFRLALTSVGIFVSVFLYACAFFFAESYYNSKFIFVNEFSQEAVVIQSEGKNEEIDEAIYALNNEILFDKMTMYEVNLLFTPFSGDNWLSLNSYVHGVTQMESLTPFVNEGKCYASETKLVKGRLINETDVANSARVIVINETTAKLMFPGEEPLGQKVVWEKSGHNVITWNEQTQKMEQKIEEIQFEVIGVVEDKYHDRLNMNELRARYEKSGENVYLVTNTYIPQTAVEELTKYTNDYYIVRGNEERRAEEIEALLEKKTKRNLSNVIVTKNTERNRVADEHSRLKKEIDIATMIMCVFSGIAIMCVTFFSVKERIPEIGIRKTFGAGTPDIVFQLLFEIVFAAIKVSVLATGTAYLLCCIVCRIMYMHNFIVFSINVSNLLLFQPVLVGTIEAAVCALFPAVYGSKINAVDALKFE